MHSKAKRTRTEFQSGRILFYCPSVLSLFDFDYFLAVICSAVLANAMCENILMALGALNESGSGELGVVGSSLISACAGHFLLRYCHIEPPSRSTLMYAVDI